MSIKQDVFAGIQSFADMYSCTELESAARRYIYSHFLDAIQHEEFLQLSDERLIDLLKSDQLQVNTEEQVGVMYSHSVEQGPAKRWIFWQLCEVPLQAQVCNWVRNPPAQFSVNGWCYPSLTSGRICHKVSWLGKKHTFHAFGVFGRSSFTLSKNENDITSRWVLNEFILQL